MRLIKLLLVIALPFFFYLNPFLPWPKDLIFEPAGHGFGVLAFFEAQKTGMPAPCSWEHCSYLLGQISLMAVYRIFGTSTFTTILNTSILAFATILIVFFFTKRFLGFWGGWLASLLFSGSLFFLMVIKTAYPFYATGPFTASLTILSFLMAHLEKRKKWLWLSGISAGLVGLSGGQTIPLVLGILIAFLGWKIINREKIFPLKTYFLVFLIALVLYFGTHALFPLINNNQPFVYLQHIYRMLTERGGQVKASTIIGGPSENTYRLLKAFFINMDVPRQGHQHFLADRAMLPLPFSLFFLIGIASALRKRKDEDKMFLLWMGINFLFYSLYVDFQVRYFIIIAPVIYILTAQGILWSIKKINKKAFLILLVLIISLYLYTTYRDYYVVLAKQAFKLEQFEGQEEMANFIKDNYHPQEVFLIMGNVNNLPPQNFLFYTWDNQYNSYFWNYLIETVITTEETPASEEFPLVEYHQWEKEKLETLKSIVYVFSFHNADLTPTQEWRQFRKLRPYIEPKKIIYASSGFPQLGIYEVNATHLAIKNLQFELTENRIKSFTSTNFQEIKALVFSGKTENPKFFLNNSILDLPINTYPSEEMSLVFNSKSHFIFNPSFSTNNYEADIYRARKVVFSPSYSLVAGVEDEPGELVYQLKAPELINKLNILFFPNFLHDKKKENYLRLSFSSDDQNYETIYEIKSDGSGGWEGRRERLTINPEMKVVFLKFEFSSETIQLSSSDKQTMSFEGEFESKPSELKIRPGNNSFWFTGGEGFLSTSLYFFKLENDPLKE